MQGLNKMENTKENKHLTYFKVENFKNFESFEMNDIGQFNLIVGDNNVGKTNLLEALVFDYDLYSFINSLKLFYKRRNLYNNRIVNTTFTELNFYKSFLPTDSVKKGFDFSFKSKESTEVTHLSIYQRDIIEQTEEERRVANISDESFAIQGALNLKTYYFLRENDKLIKALNESFRMGYHYYPFIHSGRPIEEDIPNLFSSVTEDIRTRKNIESQLKLMIPNLLELALKTDADSNNIPDIGIYFQNNKRVSLSSQGDGAIKLLQILLEINVKYNITNRLMIDEIDNGIHFSKFKSFMTTVLHSAEENGVQLFMTTHSKECIQYFKEALEELGEKYQEKARLISLTKSKDGNVKSFNFNYPAFSRNIELENEMRD